MCIAPTSATMRVREEVRVSAVDCRSGFREMPSPKMPHSRPWPRMLTQLPSVGLSAWPSEWPRGPLRRSYRHPVWGRSLLPEAGALGEAEQPLQTVG
jgi:hypothetical protein